MGNGGGVAINGSRTAHVKLTVNTLEPKKEAQIESASKYVSDVLSGTLCKEEKYTGTIVFTVNCRSGGIGSVHAFAQHKI